MPSQQAHIRPYLLEAVPDKLEAISSEVVTLVAGRTIEARRRGTHEDGSNVVDRGRACGHRRKRRGCEKGDARH